jgi:F-type H+-transporting ATPase subunit b
LIPDITVLWVIFFVLVTVYLLNTLVFQPILGVIEARLRAVSDARNLAQTAADRARAAAAEYDEQLGTARAQVYREMDEKRRVAVERRAALLGDTRATIERELTDAGRRVEQQAGEARQSLDREADALAGAIVARVLGRAS